MTSIIDLTGEDLLEISGASVHPMESNDAQWTPVMCQLQYKKTLVSERAVARTMKKGLLAYDPIRKEYIDPSDDEECQKEQHKHRKLRVDKKKRKTSHSVVSYESVYDAESTACEKPSDNEYGIP